MKHLIKRLTMVFIIILLIQKTCGALAAGDAFTLEITINGNEVTLSGNAVSRYVGLVLTSPDGTISYDQKETDNNSFVFNFNVKNYGTYNVTVGADKKTLKSSFMYMANATASFDKFLDLMYEGEACSFTAVYSDEIGENNLIWKSSDESVISTFGSENGEKTVVAKNCGMAVLTLEFPEGNVLDSKYIMVKPVSDKTVASSIFELGDSLTLNKQLIGTNNQILTDLLESNITFNVARIGYNPAEEQVISGNYSKYNVEFLEKVNSFSNDITYIVNLSRFEYDTAEELAVQAQQIYNIISGKQDKVYIEFGNEIYDKADIVSVNDYIEKVKALYPAVKMMGDNVYAGVPVLGKYFDDIVGEKMSWNDYMEEISSCFDAVIPHNYSNVGDYALCTQDVFMKKIFSKNSYHRISNAYLAEKYADKQIWVTEYGHLNDAMFSKSGDERDRTQTSKTTGVAIAVGEAVLDMTLDPNINFASYHVPNDSQGFGLVQNDTTLPGFYVFKKLSELMQNNTMVYKINPVYTDTFKPNLSLTNGLSDINSVGAYGFGNENRIEYVVFVNRSKNLSRVCLSNFKLSPEWVYSDDNIMGTDYLQRSIDWLAAPSYVSEPQTPEFVINDDIIIPAYSMIVCRVYDGADSLKVAFDIHDGEKNVEVDRIFKVIFNKRVSEHDITLYKNGLNVPVTVTGSDKVYTVVPTSGLESGTSYSLSASECEVSFFTKEEANENSFDVALYKVINNEKIYLDEPVCGETYLTVKNTLMLPESVYLAEYDKNDNFSGVEKINSTDFDYCFNIKSNHSYKLFFWENLKSLKPIVSPYVIKH